MDVVIDANSALVVDAALEIGEKTETVGRKVQFLVEAM
jgi:hypothetical protein